MTLRERWDAYWFRPTPLVDLACCRVALALFLLVMMVFPDLVLTIPPWTRHDEFAMQPDGAFEPVLLLRLLTLPFGADYRPTELHLQVAHAVAVASALCALIGLFTRTSLAVLFIAFTFVIGHSHSFGEFHHIETIPAILLLLLALSPSGAVLSIDNRRRRTPLRATSPFAGWPLKATAWVFSMVYLSAAASKMLGSGIEWLNGTTLQRYLMVNALYWDQPLGVWVAEQFAMVKALGWFTIAFEATFFVVLLRPRLGPVYALLGTGLHVGIWLTMKAPFIAYLPCYAVFVPWSRLVARPRT